MSHIRGGGSDPPQIWATSEQCPDLPIGLLSGSFEISDFDPNMWGSEGGMMSHIRGADPPQIWAISG